MNHQFFAGLLFVWLVGWFVCLFCFVLFCFVLFCFVVFCLVVWLLGCLFVFMCLEEHSSQLSDLQLTGWQSTGFISATCLGVSVKDWVVKAFVLSIRMMDFPVYYIYIYI